MKADITAQPHEIECVRTILRAGLSGASCRVWVFGSRARGTKKLYADLDLAIDVGRALEQEERIRLSDAFDESDLPYKVDILDVKTAQPAFVASIQEDFIALKL